MSSTIAASTQNLHHGGSGSPLNTPPLLQSSEDEIEEYQQAVAIDNESQFKSLVQEKSLPGAVDFQGDIVCDATGTAYVIDSVNSKRNSENKELREDKNLNLDHFKNPAQAIQFLTFFNNASKSPLSSSNYGLQTDDKTVSNPSAVNTIVQSATCLTGTVSNEHLKSKVASKLSSCGAPLVRSFRVHMLARGDDGQGENVSNNNNNVTRHIKETEDSSVEFLTSTQDSAK